MLMYDLAVVVILASRRKRLLIEMLLLLRIANLFLLLMLISGRVEVMLHESLRLETSLCCLVLLLIRAGHLMICVNWGLFAIKTEVILF
jgi:hypothetical protein